MEVGILGQIKYPERIIRQVLRVLTAARETGVRVFFSRHLFIAKRAHGHIPVPYRNGLATGEFTGAGQP